MSQDGLSQCGAMEIHSGADVGFDLDRVLPSRSVEVASESVFLDEEVREPAGLLCESVNFRLRDLVNLHLVAGVRAVLQKADADVIRTVPVDEVLRIGQRFEVVVCRALGHIEFASDSGQGRAVEILYRSDNFEGFPDRLDLALSHTGQALAMIK